MLCYTLSRSSCLFIDNKLHLFSSDFVADEKKASTLSRADGNLSASQPSTGYQPAWVGAHGQKSMADIVKMGKPQSKVSSTPTSSHYSGKHQ